MSAPPEPASDFSAAEIETGRRLFAAPWSFIAAAGSLAALPPMAAPEIAFAGRSNVGKSSLINALTGRRALARTSNTPGRTQELIFFARPGKEGGSPLVLVDMPGYGYAAAAKQKISAWTRLIQDYLHGRATLLRVYLLIDARHGAMAADTDIFETLDEAAVSYQVVLTKSDRVGSEDLAARLDSVRTMLARRAAAYPQVLATSAEKGTGIADLRAAVSRLLHERA
ncbi:MAG TPA: ribosome biogenesis GTP-binding protein YihA/YsxC [Xanthobacteraceae bacterium]|nr:ribosome biogenesis GTP-binding protein YihA/YsxC [Xanthobacteraceae bacterium]